jgi:hypothetical protein
MLIAARLPRVTRIRAFAFVCPTYCLECPRRSGIQILSQPMLGCTKIGLPQFERERPLLR